LRPELQRQIARHGLSSCVRLWGFQENPHRFIAAADAFVLSSLWEGFGNVIVEAMACGVPVIATDCPHGPAEIITHRKNGLLVPPADSRAMATAILELLQDQPMRRRLAAAGQARSLDFAAHRIARCHGALFQRLAGQQPSRQSAAA
jgi:glycosyltransferase involved in cell wall biosynthesis